MVRFRQNVRPLLAGALAATLIPGAAWAQTNNGIQGYLSTEPHYGTPNSVQYQATSIGLDLYSLDDEPAADGTLPTGDSDTVGGAFTYFKAGLQKGERYELRYQHARRIKEGSRARFLLDIPLDVSHADKFSVFGLSFGGPSAVYGTVSGGVELPVKPNWLITPRVAYSNLQAPDYFGKDGEMVTGSLTSRFKIAQIGRGDLTLGNMAAYTRTIKTPLSSQPFFATSENYVLRNGLAYQLPLKKRMFGRQASVRASYVYTYTGGGTFLAYREVHELGINIGVRTREAEQKNKFEQMRVGLLYTHAKSEIGKDAGFDSVTLTLGYRF